MLGSPLISLLFWILICFSIAALFTKRYSIRPLIVALILRSIYYLGIGPTLNILGALNVSARGPPPPTPNPSWACHAAGPEAGLLLCPFPLVPVLGPQAHYRPEVGTTLCLLFPLDNLGRQALRASQPGAALEHQRQGCWVPSVSCALPEGTLRTSKVYVL